MGNFSYHCISNPDACEIGFTVTFWLRVNEPQNKRVVLQIASAMLAVGTTVEINGDVLSVHVNSPVQQRNVEVRWPYSSWVFVALSWNNTENKINVLLNCSIVPYVKNTVEDSLTLAPVPPYHTLILGANNARLRSTRMIIDELTLWNGVLSKEDIRYIMESKAGKTKTSSSFNVYLCFRVSIFYPFIVLRTSFEAKDLPINSCPSGQIPKQLVRFSGKEK